MRNAAVIAGLLAGCAARAAAPAAAPGPIANQGGAATAAPVEADLAVVTEGVPRGQYTITHQADGTILVTSPMPAVAVEVDGVPVGQAPQALRLASGRHQIRLVANGY